MIVLLTLYSQSPNGLNLLIQNGSFCSVAHHCGAFAWLISGYNEESSDSVIQFSFISSYILPLILSGTSGYNSIISCSDKPFIFISSNNSQYTFLLAPVSGSTVGRLLWIACGSGGVRFCCAEFIGLLTVFNHIPDTFNAQAVPVFKVGACDCCINGFPIDCKGAGVLCSVASFFLAVLTAVFTASLVGSVV